MKGETKNQLLPIYKLWPSGEMGQPSSRHPDVTSQSVVPAEAQSQVSVGIKIDLEVTMNVKGIKNLMCKTVSMLKHFFLAVACVSCLSFAPLTRACKLLS